jgi:hypothetical protein
MNNHPNGVQRNTNVLLTLTNDTAYAGICASADNIGITIIPTKSWENYEYVAEGIEGYTESPKNTYFFPWTQVVHVLIAGGNN